MDIQNILIVIAIVINIFLGSIIFFRNRGAKENKWFLLFVFTLILWCFCMFFYRLAPSKETSIFWAIALYEAAMFIPIALLHFSVDFPKGTQNISKYLKLLLWVPVAILVFLIAAKGKVIKDVIIPSGAEKIIIWGPYYYVFNIYITTYFLTVFVTLFKKFTNSTGILKTQFKFMLFGLLGPCIISNATNLILPTFGIFSLNWVGQITTLPLTGFIVYAITKHQLLNVKVIATELFSILVTAVLLVDALLYNTVAEFILKFFLFLVVGLFSYLLIRSVVAEIHAKEKIAKISEDLRVANIELKRLDKIKSEFLSIASHQLRTPLTIIKGYSSMILEGEYGKISETLKGIMEKIFQSTQRLVLMVDDFLNISKIESGKMNYDFVVFDVKKMTEDLIKDMVTNNHKVGKLNLSLVGDVNDDDFELRGDKNKITQVLSNIIDNAIKYTEEGGITVRISRINDSNTGKILITVRDTGTGIEPTMIPRLFQKFSRSEAISRLHTEGSGLGLYVAKMIIEDHGGRIWAESAGAKKGSVFFIELPAKVT